MLEGFAEKAMLDNGEEKARLTGFWGAGSEKAFKAILTFHSSRKI
jgi:hypothetical protein